MSRTFQDMLRDTAKSVHTAHTVVVTSVTAPHVSQANDRSVATASCRDQESVRVVTVGVVTPQMACRDTMRGLRVPQRMVLGATRMPRTVHTA